MKKKNEYLSQWVSSHTSDRSSMVFKSLKAFSRLKAPGFCSKIRRPCYQNVLVSVPVKIIRVQILFFILITGKKDEWVHASLVTREYSDTFPYNIEYKMTGYNI